MKRIPTTGKKAHTTNTAEWEIRQLETQRRKAHLLGDTATLDQLYANDYVSTNRLGIVRNKSQVLSDFNSGAVTFDTYVDDDMKVRVYDNTAVVIGRTTRKGQYKDRNVGGRFRYIRVYVKRQRTWQIVAHQTTLIADR